MLTRLRLVHASVLCLLGLLQLAGVSLSSPVASAEPLTESAIEGLWYGEPLFNAQHGHVAIRIQRDAKGRTIGLLSALDIDMRDLPIGVVTIDANRVTIGPLAVDYDPTSRTLSGVIPDALTPVHAIAFRLSRTTELPPPNPAPPEARPASPRWEFGTGSPVWGGLAVSGGRLFLGTDAGEVIALDAKNGRPLWRFGTSGAVRSRPEPGDGDLFIASDDGFAYRLDASDGTLKWKARLGEATTRSKVGDSAYAYDSYASSPTLSLHVLLVGNGNDLVALDAASGKELWRYATAGAVSTKPAIADGLAFVGSFDGKLHAVDARTGALVWSHDFGAPVTSSPALSNGRVIVGSRSYELKALRSRDGKLLWTQYYWFSWVESSPSIAEGTVFVGSSDSQKPHAFDSSSGKESWSLDTGGSAWAQPMVSKERIYIGSVGVAHYLVDHRATFWCVDRRSGKARWRFDLAQPDGAALWGFASSPAIDATGVYAATLDGRVFAFGK